MAQAMKTDPTDAELHDLRQRTIDGMYRCIGRLVEALARDWEHCGKAACLRSRRCRGFACTPEVSGGEDSAR